MPGLGSALNAARLLAPAGWDYFFSLCVGLKAGGHDKVLEARHRGW